MQISRYSIKSLALPNTSQKIGVDTEHVVRVNDSHEMRRSKNRLGFVALRDLLRRISTVRCGPMSRLLLLGREEA